MTSSESSIPGAGSGLSCPLCGRPPDRLVVTEAEELLSCEDCAQQRGLSGQALSLDEWMAVDAVRSALMHYGITDYDVAKTPQSEIQQPRAHVWEVRSEGQRFVLKRIHSWLADDAIRYQHSVLAHLAQQRLPVPRPVLAGDGASFVQSSGARWALYAALDGRHVNSQDWMWRVPRVAELMATLHQVLEGFTPEGSPHPAWDGWSLARLDALMAQWPPLPELSPELLDSVRARLEQRYFAQAYQELPRTVVHGELSISNVLWVGDSISGVLDFDRAHRDTALVDFGCGVGTRWPPLLRAVVATYTRVRPLSPPERAALPEALLVGALAGLHAQLVIYQNAEEAARRAQDLYYLMRDADALRRAVAAKPG